MPEESCSAIMTWTHDDADSGCDVLVKNKVIVLAHESLIAVERRAEFPLL